MKLINRLCPLCYSDSFDIVYKEFLPPEGINIIELFNPVLSSERKYNLRIVKCKNCSMVYANPTPEPLQITEFYNKVDITGYIKELEQREKTFKELIKEINEHTKQDKKTKFLLDIGAGAGILVKVANENGYNATGIEPTISAVKFGKEKLNIDLINGDFLEYDFGEKKFDVITMIGVLAHLYSPDEVIKKINSLLNINGILIIITPDFNCFFSKLLKNKWRSIYFMVLNYFTEKTLTKLLEKNNFSIITKQKGFKKYYSINFLLTQINIKNKFLLNIKEIINKSWIAQLTLGVNLFEHICIISRKK